MSRTLVPLVEEVQISNAGRLAVDEENCIIRGVKILGVESKTLSGKTLRTYTPEARRQAARMYEGMGFNMDHPDRKTPNAERSVRDRGGWFESVEDRPDGVYGNMHCLKTHDFTPTLMEIAKRNPSLLGISHNANGYETSKNGQKVIESIENVISIDVVQRPATNTSLFESQQNDAEKSDKADKAEKKTLKQFLEAIPGDPEGKSGLVKFLESDLGMGMVPSPETEDGTEEVDQVWAAFKTAIASVIDDAALDSGAKLKKIGMLLKTHEKFSADSGDGTQKENAVTDEAKTGEAAAADAAAADKSKMESMQTELDALKAKDGVRSLLESQQIAATPARITALMNLDDEARKPLLEDFKAADRKVQKPGSRSILESKEEDVKAAEIPEDPKEFAKFARQKTA